MHWLEKKCISLRHAKFLEPLEWLWGSIRPAYDFFWRTFFKKGLKRVINGQDLILIASECRGLQETYEPHVWTHMMQRVKSGYRIADVGGNIGLYAIALGKRVGLSGRVFVFEPDRQTFRVLQKNIGLNFLEKTVVPKAMAVSDCCGEVVFQEGVGAESRLSFGEEGGACGVSIRVQCTTLDDFFLDGSVDLLKIDVEGFEQQVLMGGEKLLSDPQRAPRYIYVEVHPFAWEKTHTTGRSLLTLLRGYGYEVYFLDGQRVTDIKQYGEIYCVRE